MQAVEPPQDGPDGWVQLRRLMRELRKEQQRALELVK
jgi:hypothetical protein